VFSQIGLVMVIGLAAKNAILIVEFAKVEHETGKSLIDAALAGARVRLRPILMTAFAFILGVVPLVLSTGAGANSRHILGTTVIGGMLAATAIAIFIIPVTFYVAERFRRTPAATAPAPVAVPAAISGGAGDDPADGGHSPCGVQQDERPLRSDSGDADVGSRRTEAAPSRGAGDAPRAESSPS
jgi:HAE1 family hydrophobic/amphiphilic exporter-1